jgi:uncharacterized protein (TIGR03437 family)
MRTRRSSQLDQRLEAYSSTLRAFPLQHLLKRGMANWQLYAAITGSAIAVGPAFPSVRAETEPATSSAQPFRPNPGSSHGNPAVEAARPDLTRHAADATAAPVISPNGIAPIFGTPGTIQAGEWITIYGANLAGGIANWNGDFPITLGGTSVTINNQPAYLMYVSRGQINLQAPDDSATGTVPVTVTTAAGSVTTTVTLGQFAPAFNLIGPPAAAPQFVTGIILRPRGQGAYGNGAYDILGPGLKSLGYSTMPASPGDSIELFGVGFGPTDPTVPAGHAFTGAAPVTNPVTLYINNIVVPTTFVGISGAGVIQINLTVPRGLGQGAVPISATVGGVSTASGALFQLNGYPGGTFSTGIPPNNGTMGRPNIGGSFGSTFGGSFGGNGGGNGGGTGAGTFGGSFGGGGGTGGGSNALHRKGKRHHPRLQFPPTQSIIPKD